MRTMQQVGTNSDSELRQVMHCQPAFIQYAWTTVFPLLWRAREFWDEQVTHEFVFQELMASRMQLWLMNDEAGFILAMLTQMRRYEIGKQKSIHILCIGGKDIVKAFSFLDYFLLWARREGCTKVIIEGRPGLTRLLKRYGFTEPTRVMERDISNIREH